MDDEELKALREVFRVFFTMFEETPDSILDVMLKMANATKAPIINKDARRYSIALYAAYLLSVQMYNKQSYSKMKKVGVTSEKLGDRSRNYASGDSLSSIQSDPLGYLAQYNEFIDQNTTKFGITVIGRG